MLHIYKTNTTWLSIEQNWIATTTLTKDEDNMYETGKMIIMDEWDNSDVDYYYDGGDSGVDVDNSNSGDDHGGDGYNSNNERVVVII